MRPAVSKMHTREDEGFGELVRDWAKDASDASGKPERLRKLKKTLGLEGVDVAGLRFQLLHRAASAIYEAHRYRAKVAVMMVHSFDAAGSGLDDFKLFAAQLKLPDARAGQLVGPAVRESVELYLGWAADPR